MGTADEVSAESPLSALQTREMRDAVAVQDAVRELTSQAGRHPELQRWLAEATVGFAAEPDQELAGYCRVALLGVCCGFAERQLSPFVAEHAAIVAPLLDEVRGVYARLKALGTPYDAESFRIRAFNYGLHKASYLDWELYLSKECY